MIYFQIKFQMKLSLIYSPQFKYHERLKKFINLSKKLRSKYDVNLILAIIMLDSSNDYEYFCHKYKTSNDIKDRFKNISINFEKLKNKNFYSEANIKKLIYLLKLKNVKDLLLFSIFINKNIKIQEIEQLLNYVQNCKTPKFPFSGDVLKDYGYESGQLLGKKLKLIEEKWMGK